MSKASLRDLSLLLQKPESLVTDLTGHDVYFRDATEQKSTPRAIVFAESESDVIEVVNFCRQHKVPIVPRGAGTGLSGGCVPIEGGLVLSTERINHLTIDPGRKIATCGPGVITKDLKDAAERQGLTYPPDPASYEECTLGGNVAECAGGLRCRRFGVTKDYVLGLRAVTADGQVLRTGIYNNNQGFCLKDILIGSEGTLAIVTEITVSLVETPTVGATILAGFKNARDAAQTVTDITSAGIIPTVMEFVDSDAVACSIEYEKSELLEKGMAALLIETSGENVDKQTASIRAFCEKNRCSLVRIENDPSKAESLWKIRRNVSKAIKESALAKISEDTVVPNSRIPDLIDFVAEMNRTSPLRINTFGHAGDGNIHVSFLSMSGTDEELHLIEEGVERVLKKVIELGGTLTGEHGIGLAKRNYLNLEFDPATLDYLKRIKYIFDPCNVLNPGKIFEPA
ncbi:MAG: FAD-binding oxidoreductase [Candidatus Zixiibacteriota bacterium]